MKRTCTACVLAFATSAHVTLAAQSSLKVTVTSADSGRPIENTDLKIKFRDGRELEETTNSNGEAVISNATPGLVSVEARAAGRESVVEPSVRLVEDRTTSLSIELTATSADSALEEVLVVARARQADPFGGVASAYRNRDELRNAVGAGADVMRALDGLPGLASEGEFANFTVRGRGPRNNLIFVDDFPLDKIVHFDESVGGEEDAAGGGRFSIFAPNSVAGAEFSPGGWSAAYGGRSGSLLRLQLAEGGETPVTSLRLDLAGAEFTYDGPSIIDDDTSVFFTARQFDFGNVFEIVGDDDIGSPEVTDIIFKSSTSVSPRDDFQVLVISANEEFTRDVSNVIESEDFDEVSIERSEQDLTLIGLTWNRLIGSSAEWANRIYIRDSDKFTSEGEAFPDLVPGVTNASEIPFDADILLIDEEESEFGWRSDYSQLNRWGAFEAGTRLVRSEANFQTTLSRPWIRYVYETTDERPEGQDFIVWRPEVLNTTFNEEVTNFSGYLQQSFEWLGFDVRPGLRVDVDGFSDETYWSPRLAIGYSLSPSLTLSLNTGLFYESPRLLTRASATDNFELANEEIAHLSVGLDYQINDFWNVLVEAYHQDLSDLVVDESRSNARVSNSGDGTNSGFDLVLQRQFGAGWTADMTYSYNRGRRDDNDGRGSYTADFSREHFFAIGGRWEINDRLQVAARWKWGSGRPGDAFVINQDVLPGSALLRASQEITQENVTSLEDFQQLNVRVDYRQRVWGIDLVTFLDIVNLTGAEIGTPLDFNPRTGRVIEEDPSLFPQVGLIFEKSW
ncbi:MAG: carboxypeptidase regulatory-like domain-containing protein [Pseudomonadota bacterium]